MLVTLSKDGIESSEEARKAVYTSLIDDQSFCGDGGRFSSPVADWFVIGGRWSGELSRATWAKKVTRDIEQLEKEAGVEVWGVSYTDSKTQKQQAELKKIVERLYQKHLPKEFKGKDLAYDRDTYIELGYEDDAMLVTETLYNALLKEYEGKDECIGQWNTVSFSDLDYEVVNPDFIGRKWLVAVDYHS
jgi:hypothetical protein